MDMGDLIAQMFLSREQAHRAHFKASGPGSYSTHMALFEFYKAVVKKADSIAEKYQGEFLTQIDIPFLEPEEGDVYETILPVLKAHKDWIQRYRYEACPESQTGIQNLIDDALEIYKEVIYKLTFLK